MAKLGLRAVRLVILRPDHEREPLPPSLTLLVIRVFEVEPPADVEPVEWTLVVDDFRVPSENAQLQRVQDG